MKKVTYRKNYLSWFRVLEIAIYNPCCGQFWAYVGQTILGVGDMLEGRLYLMVHRKQREGYRNGPVMKCIPKGCAPGSCFLQ